MVAEPAYVANMPTLMTAEELLYHHEPNKHTELVRGVLVVHEPPGGRHGRVVLELGRLLGNHVVERGLGAVYADSGFTLARNPDTVRAPDVAFVRADRLLTPEPIGYPELAPDLVVEVLSPNDRAGKVLAKVADWLTAGARLVWVIDPDRRLARVYRADGSEDTVLETRVLDGEDVIPGFTLELRSLFR